MKVGKVRTKLPLAGEERGRRRTQARRQRVVSGKRTALMSHHTQAEVHFLSSLSPCRVLSMLPFSSLFLLIFISPLFLWSGSFLTERGTVGGAYK